MTEFIFGAGAALIAVLAWFAKGKSRRSPAGPDLSVPGREAIKERIDSDVSEVVDLAKEDRPESELANLINSALK